MSITGRCRVLHLLVLLTFMFCGERIEAQRAGMHCSAWCLMRSSCWRFYVAEKLLLERRKEEKNSYKSQVRHLLLKRPKIDLRDENSSWIKAVIYLGSLVLLQAQKGQLSYLQQGEQYAVTLDIASSMQHWHGDHFFCCQQWSQFRHSQDFPSELKRVRSLYCQLLALSLAWLLACADEHSLWNATVCIRGWCS